MGVDDDVGVLGQDNTGGNPISKEASDQGHGSRVPIHVLRTRGPSIPELRMQDIDPRRQALSPSSYQTRSTQSACSEDKTGYGSTSALAQTLVDRNGISPLCVPDLTSRPEDPGMTTVSTLLSLPSVTE